ncbi:MAG TPA: energy transducer TonB [Alphaproteobacteria bacterium]|nr:energy transducer TonB [Alphaproteobacteria bacterium]
MAVSAFLHGAIAGALVWWHPSSQYSAPSVAAEIVFLPAADSGAEAPSGTVLAQDEPAPAEGQPDVPTAAEAVSEATADPEPVVPPEPSEAAATEASVEPVAEAPPPEPIAPVVEEIRPQPAPVETAAVQPEPPPVEPAVSEPVEVARALPPPPKPRPAPVKSKPAAQKPPAIEQPATVAQPVAAAPPAEIRAPVSVAAAASPAPTAATTAAAAEPAEPPVIHEPRYRHPPTPPRFPPRALELNQQGTVVVRALVGPDGTSSEIIVWRSSGYALLDQAALRAVRDWAFEPASVGGRRIASWVEVPVRFAIR